ncbi:hypothetical protein QBC35DRAFT_47238 [Podospora australis]|uniref:Subtelomeric hrmA-associated cluster protein AFUB-079030/YDR124W-like helical bundle domain-containing protein n=1 Tax=Podospora australis TaxID=1536484 RepID=A0AAN6WQP6_9PEZI|nr:hypothetical protein QBC35DRAFT_47238 [Podospora australis]
MEGYWAPLTPPFEYDLSEPVVLRRTPTHARSGPIMRPLAPLLPSSSQAGRSDRRNVAEGLRTERSAPIPREDLVNLHPSTLSQLRLFPAVGERQSENPSAEHPAPSMGHSDARAETGQRRHHDLATVVPEHRILAPPTALLARAIIHNQQLGFSNMPLWNLGYIEGFLICQKEAVTRFLQERLFVLGLQNCSRIARVIINTMVPKKSSSNPYMGGEPTRPEWWPQDMSHLDPQRMRLPDTIILITHLIRLVARPRSEHHLDFWGLHLNIARLEDAVTRSLLDWLNDEDEREQQKRTILKEVFAVAGAEEEYLMGRLSMSVRPLGS